MILAWCDGACEPINPGGVATYGAIAFESTTWKELWAGYGVVARGQGATNNVAEYTALTTLLEWLNANARHLDIAIRTDSKLVVEQVMGRWRVKAPHLVPYVDKARRLMRTLNGQQSLLWVPREHNTVADALSKRAYIGAWH